MSRLFRSAFIPLLAIVLVVWLASNTLMSKPRHSDQQIHTYSQLQQAVKKGQPKFKIVVFNPSKRSITATESDGVDPLRAESRRDELQRAPTTRSAMNARMGRVVGTVSPGNGADNMQRRGSGCHRARCERPSAPLSKLLHVNV